MKRLLFTFALLLAALSGARAQVSSFGDVPIEINAEETRFEGGIAIADRDVIIHYDDITIYCDYATYNPDTRDTLLTGNVRIYRQGQLFTGDRALYNLETKILNAADFRGDTTPFKFAGDTLSTLGPNAYLVKDGIFTTSDSSRPDWYLKARTVRIYPKDRIVFSNVQLFVGRTPIFWFPYMYQSLDREQAFTITPGYSSTWGAYLLGHFTFPLTDDTTGGVHLDLYANRGVGVGFDAFWPASKGAKSLDRSSAKDREEKKRKDDDDVKGGRNWGRFRSYFIDDSSPGTNKTANGREAISPTRYRVSLQDRTFVSEDIYTTIDINKLSDRLFLQDFSQNEFRENPNPDNIVAVTKWNEDYTFNFLARKQLNNDQDGTERLPEGSLDFKRQPVFGKSAIFYEGETSAGYLKKTFASDSLLPDYSTFRADTFHQFTYPTVLGNWLSFIPRVGFRGTFYSDSGFTEAVSRTTTRTVNEVDPVTGQPVIDPITGLPVTQTLSSTVTTNELQKGGSVFRPVFNAGFESSFKISKAYEDVQSHTWGLDGLRHVIQPYMNFSYVWTGKTPGTILQFDSLRRSTQLTPIDFPQFNTIDSIDNWTILRLGVRNRLETRRDNSTFTWFEMDTYFDTNIQRPTFGLPVNPDGGTFSNLVNTVRFTPLPWVNLAIDSQLPLLDQGYSQVNTSLTFLPNQNMQFSLAHRYINGNSLFSDSSNVILAGYLRLNDNWSLSFREQYEVQLSLLQSQTYELHRDLSSWVASLGFTVSRSQGSLGTVNDVAVILSFTLKDLPDLRLPLSFDPGSSGTGSSKNR